MIKRRIFKKFIKLVTPPILDPKNNKNKIQDFISELFFFEKKKIILIMKIIFLKDMLLLIKQFQSLKIVNI